MPLIKNPQKSKCPSKFFFGWHYFFSVFSEMPLSCSWDSEGVLFMTENQRNEIISLRSAGASYSEIATVLSLSKNTVKSYCQRNNIEGRSEKSPTGYSKGKCPECGKTVPVIVGSKPRKFCSDECRQKWWNSHIEEVHKKAVYSFICIGCGKAFTAYGNNSRKYCSHSCYVSTRYKGGDLHDR